MDPNPPTPTSWGDRIIVTSHYTALLFWGVEWEVRLVSWTQGFTLAKQVLYSLSCTSSPFCSGYFGDWVSRTICLGCSPTSTIPISASQVAGITGVSHQHHTALFLRLGLAIFFPRLALNLHPAVSASWVIGWLYEWKHGAGNQQDHWIPSIWVRKRGVCMTQNKSDFILAETDQAYLMII
jgi:hypothetical protein